MNVTLVALAAVLLVLGNVLFFKLLLLLDPLPPGAQARPVTGARVEAEEPRLQSAA